MGEGLISGSVEGEREGVRDGGEGRNKEGERKGAGGGGAEEGVGGKGWEREGAERGKRARDPARPAPREEEQKGIYKYTYIYSCSHTYLVS